MAKQSTFAKTATLPMTFTADVTAFKFITYAGAYATAGAIAAGVTEDAYSDGDAGSVVTAQTALVTLKEQVSAAGTELASDANGCAVVAAAGDYVLAVALETGAVDQVIEVELVKYKI